MKNEKLIELLRYANERSQKSSAGNRDKRFFAIIRLIYFDKIYETLDYIYDNEETIFSLEKEKTEKKISRGLIKKDLNLLVNENMLQKMDGKYYPFLFTKLDFDIDKIYSLNISLKEVDSYFKLVLLDSEYQIIRKQLFFEDTPYNNGDNDEFMNLLINKIKNNMPNLSEEKITEITEKVELEIKDKFKLSVLNYQKIKQLLLFNYYMKRDYIRIQEIQSIIEGLGYIYSDENKNCVINYLKSKNKLFVVLK